ncbi:MAG: hypothetical protein M1840_008901 [Geoglossum simile]|nr:MAG: hypothetical protein M1840_008901 [Geoglossum simile]
MRCRQPADCSSNDSNGSDIESCFDNEDEESDPDTNLTDVDTDVERDGGADLSWLLNKDKDHPPEYYLNQEDEFNEFEFMNEDYSDNRKDPDQTIHVIFLRLLNSFFDWVLNQRRGKRGRKLHGVKSSSMLCTYWKVFRLVYEGATGSKINAKLNRQMHRILKKLAKKHGLSTQKREKTAMYIEDLVEVLQTNLTTTKKRYSHGRHRMQIALFLHLAGFSANRPQALLSLRYRHIVVTLLRDPEGGPHQILLEFIYKFTKQYLGMKDANTFPIPEIIYDPSLVLSPHIILLGLILADGAFAAPNLTCAEQLSKLNIRPGCNQLPLLLLPEKADIPVFRKSIKTLYGWEISPDQPLPYSTLLPCIKKLGVLTRFPQIKRPYCLLYGTGNAFNQSGDVSDALQNLMMQHADMCTFVNHYLPWRVTVDTAAIVRGLKPQHLLIRAACQMSRWINPDRPQELTMKQFLSVNQHPRIHQLIAQQEKWKRCPQSKVTE